MLLVIWASASATKTSLRIMAAWLVNNDWQQNQAQALRDANLAPANDLESAILATLAPGAYTAILSGVGGGTGIAVIGIYKVN